MVKIITYDYLSQRINKGTEDAPVYEDFFISKEIRCTDEKLEEVLAMVREEAYNGVYYIDTVEAPEEEKSIEERTAALEEALTLLLEGATE